MRCSKDYRLDCNEILLNNVFKRKRTDALDMVRLTWKQHLQHQCVAVVGTSGSFLSVLSRHVWRKCRYSRDWFWGGRGFDWFL